jgi:putative tricarboxylic transport membrane protein
METLILVVIAGIACGIVVGLLPGIGTATILLVSYPFLHSLDLLPLFLFYFAVITTSQYYGSVSAIVFGVTGELSSLPAVDNGHKLFRKGLGARALIYSSTGSFIAAIFGILIFAVLITWCSQFFMYLLKGKVVFVLLSISLSIIIATSGRIWISILFAIIGFALGKVGYDDLVGTRMLTFGIPALDAGIPVFPLLCGLIIVPTMMNFYKLPTVNFDADQIYMKYSDKIKYLLDLQYFSSILRGSFIGFITGLIPGGSYTISSNIAEEVEHIATKKIDDDNEILMRKLISAESANNSGVISVLIPLIAMSIPIVLSESIIVGLAQTKGFTFATSLPFLLMNFNVILAGLLLMNLVNWIISGLFFNTLIRIYSQLQRYVYIIVGIVTTGIMLKLAIDDYQGVLSLIVFLVASIFGSLFKFDKPKFVLIYTFFISSMLFDEVYRFFIRVF